MTAGEPLKAAVVVASNRAAAGVYEDTTGPLIVDSLRGLGFAVGDPHVVPDGHPVAAALSIAIASGRAIGADDRWHGPHPH